MEIMFLAFVIMFSAQYLLNASLLVNQTSAQRITVRHANVQMIPPLCTTKNPRSHHSQRLPNMDDPLLIGALVCQL